MMRKLTIDYILLIIVSVIEIGVLIFLPPAVKKMSLYLYTGYYVLWSLVHHARIKRLSVKIVLEYCLIAAIAVAAIQVLLTTSL